MGGTVMVPPIVAPPAITLADIDFLYSHALYFPLEKQPNVLEASMKSPRTNRSSWYSKGLIFSIILITLALALLVTRGSSPESRASDSSAAAQASGANTTDPIRSTINITRFPHIPSAANESSVIVIGTVNSVLPARWTTADRRRPANPHTAGHTIFRPVIVDVEEYLKGENTRRTLQLDAWGGRIDDDVFEQLPDKLYEFQAGEQVVVFLKELEQGSLPFTVDGSSLWSVEEHYTITSDGQAQNYYQTLPLDELRATVQTALQP
ncbi:MAG TPA: hypothetical protein VGD69_18170 [Herpetosiphonaceae bacterium]